MKKIVIVGFFIINRVWSQDIHLSQIAFSTQVINPAAYGNHDGWERFGLHQKNQYLNTGKYNTSLLYFDAPLMKHFTGDTKAHLGIGLNFHNDVSGNGSVSNRGGKIGISSIVPLAEGSVLSVGVEGGMLQQSVHTDRLSFGNQFDGTDFNSSYNNYEGLVYPTTKVSPELGAGILYRYKNYPRVLNAKSNFWFQVGASAYHLLNSSKSMGQFDLMNPRKFVFHAETENMIRKNLILNVKFNQYMQQKQMQSILSAIVTTELNRHSLVTTNNKPMRLGGGFTYRLNDAVVPVVLFEWNEFTVMGSVDVRTNKLANSRMGGFEFSLRYSRGNHSITSKSIFGEKAKSGRKN